MEENKNVSFKFFDDALVQRVIDFTELSDAEKTKENVKKLDVGEAVDGVAGQMRLDGHQVGILRVVGQSVGHGSGVDMAADEGMVDDLSGVEQLALDIHADIALTQAVLVLLCSFHGAKSSLCL